MNGNKTKDIIKNLVGSQPFGVLATCVGAEPHTSLMAFAVDEDLESIVFVTDRGTRKYSNLRSNPSAAFLIDNRPDRSSNLTESFAVTAIGAVREIEGPDRARALDLFVNRHPHLAEFAAGPSSALMRMKVERYSVVGGLGESKDVEIGDLRE
jgi:nitroimidazol reductase NimA-like FMN-containing flavoprotein (pyridoxamine 5'-phosphate oxidase superfamily)